MKLYDIEKIRKSYKRNYSPVLTRQTQGAEMSYGIDNIQVTNKNS